MKVLERILLIDDNNIANYLMERRIRKLGVCKKVDIRNSGLSALSYLKGDDHQGESPNPDLIILDLEMPGMNGLSFLKHYQQLAASKADCVLANIVVVSAYLKSKKYQDAKETLQQYICFNKPIETIDIEKVLADYKYAS